MNSVEKEAVLHCLKSMIDEEVCEECPLYGTTGTDHCEKDCVRLAINALSGSEKPNKWIPVSERLPELNRPLLVTVYHRVYYGHLISESGNHGYPVFRIHGLGDKNRNWVQETMSHEPYSLGRIDAWMYFDIPEPYKASPTGAEGSEE